MNASYGILSICLSLFMPFAARAVCENPAVYNAGSYYCPVTGDCFVPLNVSTSSRACAVLATFSEVCVMSAHNKPQRIVFELKPTDKHKYTFDDPSSTTRRPNPHRRGAEPGPGHDPDISDLVSGKISADGQSYEWIDLNKTKSKSGMAVNFYVYGDAASDLCSSKDPVVFNTGH